MLRIRSGQVPVLLMVTNSSANEPRQTFPKLPELAIAVAILAVPRMAVVVRSTNGAFGSFVTIRIVAISGVGPVGVKATVKLIFSPGARLSGVAGFASTVKSVEPMRRCTLEITRSAAPTLQTSIVRKCVDPPHTVLKARPSSRPTAIDGPVGFTKENMPRPKVAALNSPL